MVTRTTFVESPGARLAVDIDGEGPPRLLLCHGGPGSPDDFAEIRALLTEWAIPCARFDQRGVHRSTNFNGNWDLEAYASDVEAIREALGVDQLVVFGHSWGGVVARAWAKAHPDRVRGVLLASPSAAVGSAWPEMEAQVMRYLRGRVTFGAWSLIGLWSLVAMVPGAIGDHAMGQVYRRVLRAYTGSRQVPAWVRHSSARAAHQSRLALTRRPADVLRHLGLPPGTPARAVFGDRDIYGPLVARFRDENPDIATSILPHCGHVLWHDAPDAWRAWLLDGLRACGLLAPGPPSSKAQPPR
jgi:pimeloyl-ACP methyl ester carboxylesterase